MTPEQIRHIRRLRAKRYTTNDICRITGLTADELKEAMYQRYYGSSEPDENQLIDGEPIGERIKRMKAEIRSANIEKQVQIGCRNYYDRMPRHYCEVPPESH